MNLLHETEKFISLENILWARIVGPNGDFTLKPNHTDKELKEFKEYLDFEYDNGFGIAEVYGTIMSKQNYWLERWDYDGSEGWEIIQKPLFDKSETIKKETKVFVVKQGEGENTRNFSDDKFKEIAKNKGRVYSLEKFQEEFNNTPYFIDIDIDYIRFIEAEK